jgi:hypothetical protein
LADGLLHTALPPLFLTNPPYIIPSKIGQATPDTSPQVQKRRRAGSREKIAEVAVGRSTKNQLEFNPARHFNRPLYPSSPPARLFLYLAFMQAASVPPLGSG